MSLEKIEGNTKHGGRRPGSGRKPGSPNKTTQDIKDTLERCFLELGGADFLREWAEANQTEFIKVWAKLIPSSLRAEVDVRQDPRIADLAGKLERACLRGKAAINR